jgi:succinate dehydrogenase / fumarate reductase membrane anchor subunit
MLSIPTNLGRSGFQIWLIQRISAVILGTYTIFILCFWGSHFFDNYLAWQHLFFYSSMKFVNFIVLLALVSHAWFGIWIITTDYLKIMLLRLVIQILVCGSLIYYLVWGIQILWGQFTIRY